MVKFAYNMMVEKKRSLINYDQLVAKGVPKQEIVLACHSPSMRQYTELAVGQSLLSNL